MMKWYIIIMVCLAVCVPQMTGAGTETSSSLKGLNGTLIQNQEPTQRSGIYFAQNDPKKRSNTATNDDLPKAEEKTTPSKTLTKDKNAQKSTKQIKPFVPSEKIPVDQGVDFPYDI
ncbi:MAG: hypothetical protein PVH36_05130 [Desulfobacterales bacterium]